MCMKTVRQEARRPYESILQNAMLALWGILIGVVVAVLEVIFEYGLDWMDRTHDGAPIAWLALLPLCGVVVLWIFRRFGEESRKGMLLIFEINQGKAERLPGRMGFLMMISTWLCHLVGASTGKEGVGIQIGAVVSNQISERLPRLKAKKSTFLITGMAAGFAGLFGTPFTAVVFSLEVLFSGVIEFRALLPALFSAMTASTVSGILGVHKASWDLAQMVPGLDAASIDAPLFGKIVILAICFGLLGGLFSWILHFTEHKISSTFANHPYRRVLVWGSLLSIALMLAFGGRYSGSGMNLIRSAFDGGSVLPYDFVLKFVLPIFSLGVGMIGGEVTPLFAIGTCAGFTLAPLLGMPAALGGALGLASVFAAGTNTWMSAMIVGMEIFGFSFFPFFFISVSIAYLVNGNLSIYTSQRKFNAVYAASDSESREAFLKQAEESLQTGMAEEKCSDPDRTTDQSKVQNEVRNENEKDTHSIFSSSGPGNELKTGHSAL